MYLDYFNKFRNMEPYLKIDKKEWAYIKETFDRPDIQETLVEILKDYELPTQKLTKKDAYKDFMKLKYLPSLNNCIRIFFLISIFALLNCNMMFSKSGKMFS